VIDPDWQPILEEYAALARQDNPWADTNPIAGGATHVSWQMPGGPLTFTRAQGVRKWDYAGRPYLDLWMGHGSLLLGNAHPAVVEAVARQIGEGQHVGGAHRIHLEWAARIRDIFPSCERVRFTSSGTEATLLALRIARAWTGRPRILRVDGHFHGWHDDGLAHVVPDSSGLNPGAPHWVSVAPPIDTDVIADELSEGDIAALILEPGGGSAGALPWSPDYLRALRRLSDNAGTVLIFDEVISGLRYAPGGVQTLAEVRPDLTVLAKIAAGGFPGGIVGGRADMMGMLGCAVNVVGQQVIVPHTGTFNGFPITAAAALATLEQVSDGAAQARAAAATHSLVEAINAAAVSSDVDVRAFHQSSIFHILIGACREALLIEPGSGAVRLPQEHADAYTILRCALLLEGVDCHKSHGWLSSEHRPADIEEAAAGFARAFARLRAFKAFRMPEDTPQPTDEDGCGRVCRNPTGGHDG